MYLKIIKFYYILLMIVIKKIVKIYIYIHKSVGIYKLYIE